MAPDELLLDAPDAVVATPDAVEAASQRGARPSYLELLPEAATRDEDGRGGRRRGGRV